MSSAAILTADLFGAAADPAELRALAVSAVDYQEAMIHRGSSDRADLPADGRCPFCDEFVTNDAAGLRVAAYAAVHGVDALPDRARVELEGRLAARGVVPAAPERERVESPERE